MKRFNLPLRLALGSLSVAALLWGLWPAWALWRGHEARWLELEQQRQSMNAAQQEAQTLLAKSVPSVPEALAQIQSISRQYFRVSAVPLPDASVKIELQAVAPLQLSSGWNAIRNQTSAWVTRADLVQDADGWSGTLVFKLAIKP